MDATRVAKWVLLLNGKGYQNKLEAAAGYRRLAGRLYDLWVSVTLIRLLYNIFQLQDEWVQIDLQACSLWSERHRPDEAF